jgi:hypothetical protein
LLRLFSDTSCIVTHQHAVTRQRIFTFLAPPSPSRWKSRSCVLLALKACSQWLDELSRLLRLAGEVEVARLGQELLRALDVLGLDLEVVGHPQRGGNRQLHSPRLVELRRGVNIERLEISVMN